VRIFKSNRFLAAQAETIQDELVQVRLGLGRRRVAAAGDELEISAQPEACQMRIDPGVLGI
jgi:hypothetical protein